MIAVADDVGMSSSQNEQDSRFWGRFAHVPVLEPADSQEAYEMVKYAFELSEAYNTPVLLRLTTRVCHVKAVVQVGERNPVAISGFVSDAKRWVMTPANAKGRLPDQIAREGKLQTLAEASPMNFIDPGSDRRVGFVTSGPAYMHVRESFPDAPTGTFIPKEELAQLADETKGVLLIDEAYVDFAEDNCLELAKSFDNVIILRSMSKGYSLAGMRFGFGIANEKLIKGLMKVKDSYNVDTVAIAAATAAIQDQPYFKNNVQKVKIERKFLTDELTKLGFEVPASQTNFVFAKPPKGRAIDIYNKLREQNIYVRYWAYSDIKDKLRISVGTTQQTQMLINALKGIFAEG